MKIKIGTRSSALALAQTNLFIKQLITLLPDLEIEIIKIKTTGDVLYNQPLVDIGGKSLFIKEIEEALLDKKIDIAVHSMKDMPVDLPLGLKIGCVLPREDCTDSFISLKHNKLSEMPKGATLGTCSGRRKILAHNINNKIDLKDLRGNVLTRIDKLNNGEIDAIILAVAGLKRVKQEHLIKEILSPTVFIPAVAQGIICAEAREQDKFICSILEKINHRETYVQAVTERAFLKVMGGDCKTPLGIYTELKGHYIDFIAFTAINGTYKEYKNRLSFNEKSAQDLSIIENEIKNIFSKANIKC
ncbi:MAG: hydroxymethylbilane synthase [Candidatus Midichloria sp.]|nr:hydroxymethylbilane synthase [Hyalomma marginatum]